MYERVRQLSLFPHLRKSVVVFPARRSEALPPFDLENFLTQIAERLPLEPFETYIYKIHFDRYYGRVRHYTGSTTNIRRRFRDHTNGNGAILMSEITRANIPWRVGGIWKTHNRRIKEKEVKKAGSEKTCFICAQYNLSRRIFSSRRKATNKDFPARR